MFRTRYIHPRNATSFRRGVVFERVSHPHRAGNVVQPGEVVDVEEDLCKALGPWERAEDYECDPPAEEAPTSKAKRKTKAG